MSFADQVIHWQKSSGRHHLPWQNTRDAYRIWVSEIMLQQTQVAAVIPYYLRFMVQFPSVQTLACAPDDAVLAAWAGLGYYSRARHLHACAKQIVAAHQGHFPRDLEAVMALPGIGRSTAAAILSFSTGQSLPILDGNVKRVFCRYFGVEGDPSSAAVIKTLWSIAQTEVAKQSIEAYNQGLMDLGATLCTRHRPQCHSCPLALGCVALKMDRVAQLPNKKKRLLVPTRRPVFLLLMQDERVWLERQPAPGIWAGLYSLPRLIEDTNADTNADTKASETLSEHSKLVAAVHQWLARRAWVPQSQPELRLRFKHALTHFKLDAQCWHVQLPSKVQIAAEPGKGFYGLQDRKQLGLPKPIQTLLDGLSTSA